MKKIILIIMFLLLTGCNCDYEVSIENNSIKENVKIDVDNGNLYNIDENDGDNAIFLLENDIHPMINNNDIIYDKEINNIDNGKEIILKHDFDSEDYKNYSYVLNMCFENVSFDYNNGNYVINLSGYFYCYNGDGINIFVKSDNVIKEANGKKNGTTYQWTIDESNYENVNISIEISDESKVRKYIYIIIIIAVGIIILIGSVYFIGNIMGRDSINSI